MDILTDSLSNIQFGKQQRGFNTNSSKKSQVWGNEVVKAAHSDNVSSEQKQRVAGKRAQARAKKMENCQQVSRNEQEATQQ